MNNELYHHGIRGMKWGVRRYQNKDGSLTNAGKKRYNQQALTEAHEDYKKAHDRKSVSSMSDSELKNRLNRLNMERNYNQLTYDETHRGKAAVKKVLAVSAGVATATTTALTIYNNADKIQKIIKAKLKK